MDPSYVAVQAEEDSRHWRFIGRLAVLLVVVRGLLSGEGARRLELGCGPPGPLDTRLARCVALEVAIVPRVALPFGASVPLVARR